MAASYENKVLEYVAAIAGSFTGQALIPIDITAAGLASTGGPMAVFADSANNPSVPGPQINNSESHVVRWNNAATFTGIMRSVYIPSDIDTSYPATVNLICFKVGATLADATTFTIGAFLQKVGQLVTDDADFGGASNAVVGNAATLTLQLCQRTLSAANLAAALGAGAGGVLTLTIAPTAATMGTDDMCLYAAFVAYTRRSAVVAV
jgi:hypothetical protein